MDSLSVVIRSKNEERLIGRSLEAILGQTRDCELEIIVVDSGSADQTVAIASAYPVRIFHIPPESFSYGYALNYGIRQTRGSVICNLSAHCVPTNPGWLKALTDPIRDGRADAVYGRQIPFKGMNPWEEFGLETLFPEDGSRIQREAFSNANCAFRKTLWEAQKFDEVIPRWEDYLWYCLLKDKCRFLYSPSASVNHSHPVNFRALAKQCYHDGIAAKYFKTRYAIDIAAAMHSGLGQILRTLMIDILAHIRFFSRGGYVKEMWMTPIIKTIGYFNYFRGYADSESIFKK